MSTIGMTDLKAAVAHVMADPESIDTTEPLDWTSMAIDLIGVVDYDMEKECINIIADEGECSTVNEVAAWLKAYFG